MRSIMLAVSTVGSRVFRFHSALSWVGRVQRQATAWSTVIQPSDIVIRNSKPLHVGVSGGADLVGYTPITVTPAMVGKVVGVFTAIEVKVPGARTQPDRLKEQQNFISQVVACGGIGFFAESEEQALLFIESFRMNNFQDM